MSTSEIFELIKKEHTRQENEICLIASENYVSTDILKATGSCLINKYSEGYPNHRYYGGCEIVDLLEQKAIDLCKQVFMCKYANVQPHSGSQANQAVYLALLNPGDTILAMSLEAGGHLTHSSSVSATGKIYNVKTYGITDNGDIDYQELEDSLYDYQPKLLIVGASAYPRIIDFERVRKILDKYNESMSKATSEDGVSLDIPHCYLMVDMAHIAGLVSCGLHPSPIPYADVVTSTTHKTLRGARGGIILTNNESIAKKINKAVFPGNQGGPLQNMIAGKAICFEEALKPEFYDYQLQVVKNCQAMASVFHRRNVPMITGGTDNHLILLDLRDYNFSGKDLEQALVLNHIVVNKNAVKDDPRPKTETSGVRIGTPAMTTRGCTQKDAELIANVICNVIEDLQNSIASTSQYKNIVLEICKNHPVYGDKIE